MGNKSATTRLSERDLDWYPTPDWATEALFDRVDIDGTVFEPCVGDGRMADVIRRRLVLQAGRSERERKVWTNDLSVNREADFHRDASDEFAWDVSFPRVDWSVTNPPFNVAHRILPLALKYSRIGVAFLLRLSYLEPVDKRAKWLARYPPAVTLITPRISFKRVVRIDRETGEKKVSATDNMTTFWGVWYKQPVPQRLEIIMKEHVNGKR